jgi:hypothetical protein
MGSQSFGYDAMSVYRSAQNNISQKMKIEVPLTNPIQIRSPQVEMLRNNTMMLENKVNIELLNPGAYKNTGAFVKPK